MISVGWLRWLSASALIVSLFFLSTPTQAMVVAPTRQTIVVNQGNSSQVTVFVVNDEGNTRSYVPEIDAFTAADDGLTPLFGQADVAKQWITVRPQQLTLAPKEQGSFTFTVTVPEQEVPGVHYLGLFAKQQAAEGQVAFASRAGSLLYLYVAGDITEELQMQQFGLTHSWVRQKSMVFFLQAKNVGNIHVIPRGEMIIRNMKDTIISTTAINTEGKKVLANDTWKNEYAVDLPRFRSLGKNRAQVVLYYGFGEKLVTNEFTFWYIPAWLVAVLALVITSGIGLFVIRRRR